VPRGSDDTEREILGRLSFTHRREHARWVGEAKKPETRATRAQSSVAMLRDGVRHPERS
jgi:uncharacterized protein YdeI (YjbR/CyaY-like superfamily)